MVDSVSFVHISHPIGEESNALGRHVVLVHIKVNNFTLRYGATESLSQIRGSRCVLRPRGVLSASGDSIGA